MLSVAGIDEGWGVLGGVTADSIDERPGTKVERPSLESSVYCLGNAEAGGVRGADGCSKWHAEIPLRVVSFLF